MRRHDKRLGLLARKALLAIENPARGIVLDDFGIRYAEAERRRDLKSAAWFYRDKTSFETKYDEDGGRDGEEPAWVSDGGRGACEHYAILGAVLDQPKREPRWLRLWRRKRLELSPKHRAVLDALALDWRSRPAARLAGVDHKTVDLCKKIFKTHFAQCHTAWKRDFAF